MRKKFSNYHSSLMNIFCSYAKTAKKVDMKRLKVVAWSILSQASNEVRIALEVDC